MARYPDLRFATTHQPELRVIVERPLARCGAWYEMFPRSASRRRGDMAHSPIAWTDCRTSPKWVSTFSICRRFIRSVGRIAREKTTPHGAAGRCRQPLGNRLRRRGAQGDLTDLGTLADFRKLREAAAAQKIELALDVAYQCSPDHPYVAEHSEWFRRRPDGTIQYAENPPKKYEDIFPLDFETDAWRPLWEELKSIVLYWAGEGCGFFGSIIRTPSRFHFGNGSSTSSPPLSRRAAAGRGVHPAEMMFELAKLGFTQSYTYFTWRNTRQELTDYFQELSGPELQEIFRPNLFANTPDILHGVFANRRAGGVRRPADSGRHAGRELRHLWAGIRALRKSAAINRGARNI